MIEQDSITASLKRYGVPLALLALGMVGFFVLSSLRGVPASTQPEKLPPMVDTVPIQSHVQQLDFEVDGEVIPYREVSLAAEVAGRIVKKSANCRSGRYVTAGQVLLQIDPQDYDLEVRRLQEMVRQADASINELVVETSNSEELIKLATEDLQLERGELKRIESLFRRRVASDSELDTARRKELTSRNRLQTLTNSLRLLKARRVRLLRDRDRIDAELEKAKLDRARTEIKAPIDGIVMQDHIEQDAYVAKGAMLVSIEDTSKVEVRINLKMDELRWLWRSGQGSAGEPTAGAAGSYELPPAAVTVAYTLAGQEFDWQGRLSRYDGAGMSAATRTVPCIAVVDDPRSGVPASNGTSFSRFPAPPALIRGMFVTAKLSVPTSQPLLAVPEAAIRPGNKIWVVRDGQLSIEEVSVAQTFEDNVLLLDSRRVLAPGTPVVTSPLPVAVNGMPLRMRNDQPQAADAEVAETGAGK